MKAAVASTIMIQNMMMAHWKKNGTLNLKEAADVAHRYSREIEHSDENKGLLEDILTRKGESVSYTHLDVYKRQRKDRKH